MKTLKLTNLDEFAIRFVSIAIVTVFANVGFAYDYIQNCHWEKHNPFAGPHSISCGTSKKIVVMWQGVGICDGKIDGKAFKSGPVQLSCLGSVGSQPTPEDCFVGKRHIDFDTQKSEKVTLKTPSKYYYDCVWPSGPVRNPEPTSYSVKCDGSTQEFIHWGGVGKCKQKVDGKVTEVYRRLTCPTYSTTEPSAQTCQRAESKVSFSEMTRFAKAQKRGSYGTSTSNGKADHRTAR